jgi:hypothetical protein
MKYKGRLVLGFMLIAVFMLLPFSKVDAFRQQKRDTVNLQTYIISDFGDYIDRERGTLWRVRFSRFAKPVDFTVENADPDPEACAGEYIQAKPMGLPQEQEARQHWALGIKAQFIKQSYNWIELVPHKPTGANAFPDDPMSPPNSQVESEVSSLDLFGIVHSLDIWVWGGNYRYWMEFHIRDFKGYMHRIQVGDLNYIGWRNLRTNIPGHIPQAQYHVPFLQPLKLDIIKLWSYPTERVDQFYAYFDYMQVQTDVHVERFDGDDLARKAW